MAKVFTITVPPKLGNKRRQRTSDPRYVDGQRLLVEAMKYLAQADPVQNRPAIELISEHVRTRFRMSDSPLGRCSGTSSARLALGPAVKERRGQNYDRGITFQRVARLGIFQAPEKCRTKQQK